MFLINYPKNARRPKEMTALDSVILFFLNLPALSSFLFFAVVVQ